MYYIVITVISFIILMLCALYILKEIIRRRKQKMQKTCLEINRDIRVSILMWIIGSIALIGFTAAQFAELFNDMTVWGYLILCIVGLSFASAAFLLAVRKTILNKETGEMISCSLSGIKKFNVKDITLIKHTRDAWAVFSDKKKLFEVKDRYHDYSEELYIYIRTESGCKEIHPTGHCGRDIEN